MIGERYKDSRWFSFFDHAQKWNIKWHTEMMILAYSFFLQGKDPWSLSPPKDNTEPTDTFSSRVAAWNVIGSVLWSSIFTGLWVATFLPSQKNKEGWVGWMRQHNIIMWCSAANCIWIFFPSHMKKEHSHAGLKWFGLAWVSGLGWRPKPAVDAFIDQCLSRCSKLHFWVRP